MTLFLSPDTQLITRDRIGRTAIKSMQCQKRTIFDGQKWIEDVHSSIVAHSMDMYKVTFSDGNSITVGDIQKLLMRSGIKRIPKRLSKRSDVALGRFHTYSYKDYSINDVKNHDSNLYPNYLKVVDVKYSHRGIALGLDNLTTNQAVCLFNGAILQN